MNRNNNKLEASIRDKLKQKDLLLMTHIVMGYPSFDDSLKLVETMVESGVDLMELQIPFSEPTADGPVILRANQRALDDGSTVERCLQFAEEVARRFDIPFLIMTYYNILYKYGVDAFAQRIADAGLYGAIIPDVPPEEAGEYLAAMNAHDLSPIFIYTPTTSPERMKLISSLGSGMIYCAARRGVTGATTHFDSGLENYLASCRESTDLPIGVGFGVKDKEDIEFLRGRADIAVIGSQTIKIVEEHGTEAAREFLSGLSTS